MAASEELGILGVHSFHYFVHRPERSHRFYTEGFGWDPVFQPEGSELSYAQLGVGVKDEIGHRGRAWADFARRFPAP